MTGRFAHKDLNRKDPFYEPPLHKVFYHPTPLENLPDEKKWVALSSDRLKKPPDPADVHFLKVMNTYTSHDPSSLEEGSPDNHSSKFDESWPASERPSTIDLGQDESSAESHILSGSCGLSKGSSLKTLSSLLLQHRPQRESVPPKIFADMILEKDENINSSTLSTRSDRMATESTLAKYVQRFRQGRPLSREERQQLGGANPADFWWMSSSQAPQGSSTPRDESSSAEPASSRILSRKYKDSTESSLTSYKISNLDSDTLKLMEKTDRLLEKSESSFDSSGPVVSTVGLGSESSTTSFGGDRNSVSERKQHVIHTGKPSLHRLGPRPEDDILYQWRVKRRQEEIRNKAASMLSAGQHSSSVAMVHDDVDSRLSEFRRKVLHEKPIHSNSPKDRTVGKVHMDGSSKADAVCQTSLDVQSRPSTAESKKIHILTAHGVPVASPALRCSHEESEIPTEKQVHPHYHLSSDILNYPTSHGPQLVGNDAAVSVQQRKSADQHKGYLSDTDTDESQRSRAHSSGCAITRKTEEVLAGTDDPVRDPGPLLLESCSDSDTDKYKQKEEISSHPKLKKGALHREQRDEMEKPVFHGKNGEARRRKPGYERQVSSTNSTAHSASQREQDMKEPGLFVQSGKHLAKQEAKAKDDPSLNGSADAEQLIKHDGRGHHPLPSPADEVVQTVRTRKRAGRVKSQVPKDRSGQSQQVTGLDDSAQPLCHSSPIRIERPITPTIHQVVTERLFEESSVEEGTASSEDKDVINRHLPAEIPLNFSDGEEFEEDDLLHELRTRRSQYHQRLKDIDKLLADNPKQDKNE